MLNPTEMMHSLIEMIGPEAAHAMGAAGQQGGEAANPITAFAPLIIMFAIFYFLLIRPQQKKAKEHKQQLENLQRGDYIVTGGGIYGRIEDLDGDVLTVNIADNVTIKINRQFVSGKSEKPSKVAKEPKS